MKLRHLLAVGLLAALAACSKSQDAPSPVPGAPAETAAPATPADSDAPAEAPAAEESSAKAETPAADAAPKRSEKASEPAPATGAAAATTLTEGADYIRIPDGTPFDTDGGKVEVAEVFNYICPACSNFNSTFQEWKKKQPSYVHVVYVPADFREDFKSYARAYYAADALGLVEKTHEAVYAAIHDEHTLPGEGMVIDPAKVAAFYAKYGADPQEFQQLMSSFTVNAKVTKAHQFMVQSQVRSTPSLIVNGQYLVKGKTWEDILKNTDALVAREHTR